MGALATVESTSRRDSIAEGLGRPDMFGGGRRAGGGLFPSPFSIAGVDDREVDVDVICAIGLKVIDEPRGDMLLAPAGGGGGMSSGMGDGGAGHRPFCAAALSTRSAAA